VQLRARQLKVADKDLCRGFNCGAAPYQKVVSDWITRELWELMPEFFGSKIRTILLSDRHQDDCLVGFASWSPVWLLEPDDFDKAELVCFGIATPYQGLRHENGDLVADQLFETVLDDIEGRIDRARAPITLNCHKDNERALRFWKRHDFVVIPDGETGPNYVEMAFEAESRDNASEPLG
jgi:ribosomal protein S18 acetylase RimI-like enzyme